MSNEGTDFWSQGVSGLRGEDAETEVQLVLPDNPDGGTSNPVKVLVSGSIPYWIKLIDNGQGIRTLINDQIVARLGHLIGAAVCEVKIVRIPEAMAGTVISGGRTLDASLVHGSRHLDGAEFNRLCPYKDRDDNRHRIATLEALYDWCCGGDDQWLFATEMDYTVYSHDHGHYFRHTWTPESLMAIGQQEFRSRAGNDGLSAESLCQAAAQIRAIEPEQIRDVISRVPSTWDVTDQELNAVGRLVDARRGPVADRLDARARAL